MSNFCTKCGAQLFNSIDFCPKCGTKNRVAMEDMRIEKKNLIHKDNFDPIFSLSEKAMVDEFISKELLRQGIDNQRKLLPQNILKRKKILNLVFSILLFVFISLIFFHLPTVFYIIGVVVILTIFVIARRFNFNKYLKKKIIERPNEKISEIIAQEKNQMSEDNSQKMFLIGTIVAILISLALFIYPRAYYEKTDNGYYVKLYTTGLTNFTTVTIPEEYNGEKVIGLRGDTFSNMTFLKSVSLPDTIIEIRGQAFKNCTNLEKINIPMNLEYLGGGAFYNASSLKSIELPDTLTYLGGESFKNASLLESVKLSNNITEIRGNTFENCSSLKSIVIPDSVTRIAAYSFYGNTQLSTVTITKNSQLAEIGSSAFRKCTSLKNISIPHDTEVNSRAFKESPTIVNKYSGTN